MQGLEFRGQVLAVWGFRMLDGVGWGFMTLKASRGFRV